jgi:hypothetical protein
LVGFDFDENKNTVAPISKQSFDACDFHSISPDLPHSTACQIDKETFRIAVQAGTKT